MQRSPNRTRNRSQKLVLWKSGKAMVAAIFYSSTISGWLVPKRNVQIHPKGKEEALSQKEKRAPFLKAAGHPTVTISSRSHCSSKTSKFSKSIKPTCVKLTQNIKPTGIFLLEFMLEVCRNGLKWGSTRDGGGRRRSLKKRTPSWQGRKEGWDPFYF